MAVEKDNRVVMTNSYTKWYRIMKTIFMVVAWISFGMNLEIVSPALEDLRILLQTNYQDIVLGLLLRNIGYMVVTTFIGLVYDKLNNYSDCLMAFATFIMITSK